jgi:hypothetical protein
LCQGWMRCGSWYIWAKWGLVGKMYFEDNFFVTGGKWIFWKIIYLKCKGESVKFLWLVCKGWMRCGSWYIWAKWGLVGKMYFADNFFVTRGKWIVFGKIIYLKWKEWAVKVLSLVCQGWMRCGSWYIWAKWAKWGLVGKMYFEDNFFVTGGKWFFFCKMIYLKWKEWSVKFLSLVCKGWMRCSSWYIWAKWGLVGKMYFEDNLFVTGGKGIFLER